MKKNGFTLVELLASIVLLAIILTLGTCCIHIVSARILASNYESKKSLIEIKAAEYASDTGFLFTNVDNLVKNGYLSADDNNGNIINPITNKSMNCLVVQVTNENNNLYGTVTENEECDNGNILQTNIHLGINILKVSDNTKVEENTWVNEDVKLEVYFKDLDVSINDVEKIIWKTNAFTEEKNIEGDFNSQNTFVVNASLLVDSTYYVEVVLKNKITYYANAHVKIDKQNPVIYEDEIKVSLKDAIAEESTTLQVSLSDSNGSGIEGYYVGESSDCANVSYTNLETNYFEIPVTNSVYYICAKDKVGNVSETISTKKVDLLHLSPPSITNIEDVLVLGTEEYDFKKNTETDFGIFDGRVSCNPTISKKSGSYDVECIAVSDNGLSSATTFHVNHS